MKLLKVQGLHLRNGFYSYSPLCGIKKNEDNINRKIMDISALELYKTIASNSNDETATKVMEALKGTIQEEIKHPIHELKTEMQDEFTKVRLEMQDEFAKVRLEMQEEFSKVRLEMKDEFSKVRFEMQDIRLNLIDRIDTSKMQTWGLIIGIGVLQLVAYYFLK